MWMVATAEVMTTMGITAATTMGGLASIFLAMTMAGAATSKIIAIEALRVVGLDTPVAAVGTAEAGDTEAGDTEAGDTEAVDTEAGVMEAGVGAMVEAEDGIELLESWDTCRT